MKFLKHIFPWASQIKTAQIAAAEARTTRYEKLSELDKFDHPLEEMVRQSINLLRPKNEPPSS